jgi:D-glycero-alpha-D-manno-heptose-7-phosphate kinase
MLYDLSKCTIGDNLSIKDALSRIDENKYGFIFTINEQEEVIGLVTDGDIRRAIIDGILIDDSISKCHNKDFLWVDRGCSREKIIKKLDGRIRFVPILDRNKKLYSIFTKNYLPLKSEEKIYIRSRAPVRVSFGGGGSDLTHYFTKTRGAVINTAISLYSHAVMMVRDDSRIVIKSHDLGKTLSGDDLRSVLKPDDSFNLIQSLLSVVRPKYGFNLEVNSDFPLGSGLGGSATVSAAILGCFNMLRQDKWDQHELSEIAFQAERLHLGIAGGWQDQYASVFGGFNFIEFNLEENIVNPIRIKSESLFELEESLVLCDTGIGHNSGNIHVNQKETMRSQSIRNKVKANVELTYKIKNYLLRGNFDDFGRALDQAWNLKKEFSSMITNQYIDDIYDGALKNGALGGKLLGAGGGGFFIFYVPPFEKIKLLEYLNLKKLMVQPFKFERNGLQAYSSRLR